MREKITALIRSKKVRTTAGIAILVLSLAAFSFYAVTHPELFQHLTSVRLPEAAGILALYFVFLFATASILHVNVQMCKAVIGRKEGFLLTIYSTIVNFFGPLQSGPGFRAIYLKKKLGIKLRDYGLATVYYYLFFAIFSAIFLLLGVLEPMAIVFAVAGLVGLAFLFIIWRKRTGKKAPSGSPKLFLQLAVVTLLQVTVVAIIYFIELRSIDSSISLQQAFTYTGAANFALFAALTPGSIGIRESFLLFSQQLHGIDSQTVIAASVIDRAFYFIFLGLLFLIATSLHAKDKLQLRSKNNE
ncbi:MAG TPA: lysylphosphatidylglycerol synthase domain-containing protein [Verrucomicrobiae bacterium]|nr:lysylphosphatidylglycerol synthase domain-containing protein [Verrucomicrobiae bacterium]